MTIPPADFNKRNPIIAEYSGELYRSFSLSRGTGSASVLYFGKSGTERWDAPDHFYGVCYLGKSSDGCFLETFGQTTPRAISQNQLGSKGLATVQADDLQLLDITGPGAYRIGATGAVWAGDRAISRLWSKAIHGHPNKVDGILYSGNHDPSELNIAVFDRAVKKLKLSGYERWSSLADLARILDKYDVALLQ